MPKVSDIRGQGCPDLSKAQRRMLLNAADKPYRIKSSYEPKTAELLIEDGMLEWHDKRTLTVRLTEAGRQYVDWRKAR